MSYRPTLPIESYLSLYGELFWNKAVLVDNEYQCILEQVIKFPDTSSITALNSAKIYRKWFSNKLYCSLDNELISKQIIKNAIEVNNKRNKSPSNGPIR